MWITQQADETYAQDISQAGVAHISFVKKEKKSDIWYLKESIKIVMEKFRIVGFLYTYFLTVLF